MLIAAFGDVHGDRFFEFLIASEARMQDADLVLMAGDIVNKNRHEDFRKVVDWVNSVCSAPMVAVFGNEEYSQDRERYREIASVTFLEDESIGLDIDGTRVSVIGTNGSLDRPTWWQRKHVPGIRDTYLERVRKVEKLLLEADGVRVLLMHYAPTYLTLEGERMDRYPEMGCKRYEKVISRTRPDLVIHAHAHRGAKRASLGEAGVPVYNVSLPLNRGVTFMEV
jgi:Icc-related predicted phosphoesterase